MRHSALEGPPRRIATKDGRVTLLRDRVWQYLKTRIVQHREPKRRAYMIENPVRVGLVQRACDWCYGSEVFESGFWW